jgi:mRNA interferase MazF
MKRGDVVLVSGQGDYGKVRPAVVVQANHFAAHLGSITVVPFTSDLGTDISIRIQIAPTVSNGLRNTSRAMVDKLQTYPRQKVFDVIGALEAEEMAALDRCLVVFLQLANAFAAAPFVYSRSQDQQP